MFSAPPGIEIIETRHQGPVRVVHVARQVPLGRRVQLVSLAPGVLSSSPPSLALLHEAEVLSHLDHPNIVRLYELRQDETHLWLVLEEVDGPSLSELREKQLSWQAIFAIGLDIARALVHAHAQGETHGHLSANSVSFTTSGRTKLSGFGARARPLDDVETIEPASPGGLSPEGSIGQPVGPLSDLFAWGSLMYELLTGNSPFGDPTDSHYASRVRNDRHKPLLLSRPDLPASLDHLVSQCLEKVPARRPSNARALTDQLEAMALGSTLPLIHGELTRLGYLKGESLEDGLGLDTAPAPRASTPPPRAVLLFGLPLAAALIAAVVSGAVVYFTQARGQADSAQAKVARDIPTEEALLLRVVATPWAHVVVDGEHRETTPFAQPISLAPGRHVVRLEHPNAAPEERVVEGRAGQSVLLNVQMHVERPLSAELPEKPPEETTP